MLKHRVFRIPLSIVRLSLAALLSTACLTAILVGCAVTPAQEESRVLAALPSAELNRAIALEAQGQAAAAAGHYLDLAATAPPPARTQLQIKALRAYLAVGQTAPATRIVETLSLQEATPLQQAQLHLAEAELALLTERPQEAVALLERLPAQTLPRTLKIVRLGILAAAQRCANAPLAAAQTLSDLDRLLDRHDDRLLNQIALIATLRLSDHAALRSLLRQDSGGVMQGWADIALLTQQTGSDPQQLEARYRQWRQAHPGHPALPELAGTDTGIFAGGYANGERVTILLPHGGRFAAAAKAIEAGIFAASRTDAASRRPALEVADLAGTEQIRARYAKALQDGADYAIGPLQKPAVEILASGNPLTVPTLALNETARADHRLANLFQFSLSPENEATEVANKAAAMGLKRALLLYPEGAWGERLAAAFRRQWSSLGGHLAGQSSYRPNGIRHDQALSRQLAGTDADLAFLVATPDMARQLYPRLRTLKTRSATTHPLTVIATSHVYAGDFDAQRDAPLVGLYFVDIPWMFDVGGDGPLSRHRLTRRADPLVRLYAMGIDAYRLAPRLARLAAHPGAYYAGQSGGLALDRLGRIQRRLELGRFSETGPQLAAVPAPASGRTR